MFVRSNPPGAMVYIDDYPIGTTPIATSFTYYGTRKIRLVKDGYETLTVQQPVPPAWYQIPPIDFISENLVPGQIRDNRTFEFQLVPQVLVPTEQVLERGEQLRRQTHAAAGTPPSALQPPPSRVPGPYVPPPSPGPYAPATPGAVLPPDTQPYPPGSAAPAPGAGLPYPTEPPGGWHPRTE